MVKLWASDFALRAWRSDLRALVSSAPARRRSASSRPSRGCGPRLLLYRPSHRSSAPSSFRIAPPEVSPRGLWRVSSHTCFHAATQRSRPARAWRRKQTAARSRPTSKTWNAAGIFAVVRRASRLISCAKRFENARIANWEERGLADNPQVKKCERSADPDQRHEVPDAYEHAGAVERGQDHDVDIDELHENDPAGDQTKPVRILFRSAQKQDRKRHEEPADDEEQAERIPGFRVSPDKIFRLFRHVRVPDEHVLAEADVSPEYGEREHPFPHDVVMLDGDDFVQVASF